MPVLRVTVSLRGVGNRVVTTARAFTPLTPSPQFTSIKSCLSLGQNRNPRTKENIGVKGRRVFSQAEGRERLTEMRNLPFSDESKAATVQGAQEQRYRT